MSSHAHLFQGQKMQVTVLNPLNQWLTIFRSFSSKMKGLENRRLGMGVDPEATSSMQTMT